MNRSHLKYSLKAAFGYLPLRLHDAIQNRRHTRADRRFLVVRHPSKNPHFYNVLLQWLAEQFPEVRAHFELRAMPVSIRDWSPYALHIPWLQDPVQRWSPSAYLQANRLAAACDEHGIPIINRVDRLLHAAKSTGARIIASVGLCTPKMARIDNVAEFRETLLGLNLPLLVREDWGHGGLVCRADTRTEAQQLPLHRFSRPVAVEFIDVQNPHDGLYRKYRYIAAGETGIAQSMHVCDAWKTKGSETVYSEALDEEEIAFASRPDPHHASFQAAAKALGLDFVAFDYSYDRAGRMVVWEANPYPHLHFPIRRFYRRPVMVRTLAAMVQLYFRRAQLAVPATIEELAATPPSSSTASSSSWHAKSA